MGHAAIHEASIHDNPVIIQALFEGGCNLDAQRHDGATPLHLALLDGFPKAALTLISLGANVEATYPISLDGSYETPNGTQYPESFRIIKSMTNARPLHLGIFFLAALQCSVVNAIVDAGASIEARTLEKHTALSLAGLSDFNYDATIILLERGARLHTPEANSGNLSHPEIFPGNYRIRGLLLMVSAAGGWPAFQKNRRRALSELLCPALQKGFKACGL